MSNFNFSEAFLLSSLKKVRKIWGKGTGEASFNLNILDGVAELQLHFKLGSPCDLHCVPDPPNPAQSFPHEDHEPLSHRPPERTLSPWSWLCPGPRKSSQASPCWSNCSRCQTTLYWTNFASKVRKLNLKENHLQKELQLQSADAGCAHQNSCSNCNSKSYWSASWKGW